MSYIRQKDVDKRQIGFQRNKGKVAAMNEVFQTNAKKEDIKSYRNEQITTDELSMILAAGSYAAKGMGQQTTVIVAVQDPEIMAQLSGLNARIIGKDEDPFCGAPTLIIVFADKEQLTVNEEGSLIVGNMMLAAASIGVDFCRVNHAKEVFELEEGLLFKRQWGVPENYMGLTHCLLGYCGDALETDERESERIIRII